MRNLQRTGVRALSTPRRWPGLVGWQLTGVCCHCALLTSRCAVSNLQAYFTSWRQISWNPFSETVWGRSATQVEATFGTWQITKLVPSAQTTAKHRPDGRTDGRAPWEREPLCDCLTLWVVTNEIFASIFRCSFILCFIQPPPAAPPKAFSSEK